MASLKRASDQRAGNISSKVYVRSTKNGRVQKIVRELYLRNDIPCSSQLCAECAKITLQDAYGHASDPVLSDKPATSKKFLKGYYLLPDTNSFLNGMDLFEQSESFCNIVVLQTVLEEVKNRSLPLYNRMLALSKAQGKNVYLFLNEFRTETHAYRKPGESINDRNDRAIRQAALWYTKHLGQAVSAKRKTAPEMILLTDDKENLKKSKAEGITASTLGTFVSDLEDGARLLDMINARSETFRGATGEKLYEDHFSVSKMQTGIREGTLHQGYFNVSPYNYLEGTVKVPAFPKPLLILGRENSNRAISGDVVTIELLPRSQWKAPSSKIVEEDTLNRNENADEEEGAGGSVETEEERRILREDVRKTQSGQGDSRLQPTAKVVGIIRRNWRQYVGHVDQSSSANGQQRQQQTVFLLPMDKKIPKIRFRTRQADALSGQRLLVTIDAWEQDSRHPVGHLVRSLGELETRDAETEALLLEYDVQYRPFPQVVLECLPSEGHNWRVPSNSQDATLQGRKDYRDLLVCSIDPQGCQDIDDALHAKLLPNGNFEVGVHIADVSHFVKPNNAMDAEASSRGTTVYLVDKRIDMLPTLLGTDLCSLKPYVERFAFSVIWELSPDANVVSCSFTKSIIRSREAFSYEQAQLRIDDNSQQDELTKGMRYLLALSKKLKAARMAAGALNLASPEVRIQTDSETSDPIDVKTKQMLETNSLVEEFMLLANIAVAGRIYSAYPQTSLLRRHAAPPATNFEVLANQLKTKRGLSFDVSSSKTLADSLDTCVDPGEPFFNTLIRILATRCMMSAEYFCSGDFSAPEFRHYGLASEIYTHFTSPIRRYADLEVHRQLAAAIGYEDLDASLRNKSAIGGICDNVNVRHRNAQLAGRASIEYYVGQALKGQTVQEPGFIMRVFENGVVVFVPRFGVEGLIRLQDMASPEPSADYDADVYKLTVTGGGLAKGVVMVFDLFAKVDVKISDVKEASTGKRKMNMQLVT